MDNLQQTTVKCDRCRKAWTAPKGPSTITLTCPRCHHNQPLTNEARKAQDDGRMRAAGIAVATNETMVPDA